MRRDTAVAALIAAAVALRAAPCAGHAVGVSRGDYRVDGSAVRVALVLARPEVGAVLPELDGDRDGTLARAEIARGRTALAAWVARGIVVSSPNGPCDGGLEHATLTEEDGLMLAAAYRCARADGGITLRLDLLADLSLGHRHLVTATVGGTSTRAVLSGAEPELALSAASAPGDAAARVAGDAVTRVGAAMLRLGVEHILGGYDHLLFLLAVVLVGGSLRAVLGVVTAFTFAHSITLGVAAAGLWTPRPTLVEPAIALSIVYVGLENCMLPDLRRRWRLAFLFGLVHGFGFAGALHEVTLSAAELPLALAAFNAGVEIGQVAVLALVVPTVWWLGRRAWFARGGLQAASAAISAIGFCWFVARVVG